MADQKITIERKALIALRMTTLAKFHSVDKFLDNAVALGLLLKEHKNAIQPMTIREEKMRLLLHCVETKMPRKSDAFLEALLRSGNDIIIQHLVPGRSISDLQTLYGVVAEPSSVEFKGDYQIDNFPLKRPVCVAYMSDMPTFIDYALEVKLLDTQQKNQILSTENADQQTRTMCDIMENKLPEKSDAFVYSLTKSGNEYLVDLLLSQPQGSTCDFSYLSPKSITRTRGDGYPEYPMQRRGRVLIIENLVFDDSGSAPDREGSEVDREAVIDFFQGLNFEIILKSDLTAEQMENVLHEEINNKKGYKEDCFILVIMSHGRESKILGKDMKTMNYSVIFQEFNNSPIWGDKSNPKPKLIYIQACQPKETEKEDEPDAQNVSSLVTPDGHFYIMYATIPGEKALRNTFTGSRLIQSLITVYKDNYLNEDIETMGIKVKSMVYKKPGSGNKQIALCHSSLPKRVYLVSA